MKQDLTRAVAVDTGLPKATNDGVRRAALLQSIGAVLQVAGPGQLRAVAYLRVSTEEQLKGYGIDYSGKRVVRRIAERGWAFVGVYADEGLSGSLEAEDRPDLKRLMEDARQVPRPFDMVGVNEGRVIGRVGRAFWRWVWELEDLGIYVHVVKKNYDNSTSAGRSQMRKDADYAEEERENIRDRTQGGLQEKAEEGGWTGGRPPYGYMIENKGQRGLSRLARDPHEHGILCRMLELVAEQGKDCEQVALVLNAESAWTREGKRWTNKNVLNKLKSEAVQKAQVTFRKPKKAKLDRDGNPVYGKSVVIPLEPTFNEQQLKKLNEALARGSVKRDAAGAPSYPYSKRIFGACGKHYSGFHVKAKDLRGYRCSGKQPKYAGAGICSCAQVNADLIEKAVWDDLVGMLGDAEKLKKLAEEWVGVAMNSKVNHVDRINELSRQIDELSDTIDTTLVVAARQATKRGLKGAEAAEAAERTVKPLNEELAVLEKQRAEVLAWQAETEAATERARDLQALAAAASNRLEKLSEPKKARLIELLDVRVYLKSTPEKTHRGRPASLPEYEIGGKLEPRLLTERKMNWGGRLGDPIRSACAPLDRRWPDSLRFGAATARPDPRNPGLQGPSAGPCDPLRDYPRANFLSCARDPLKRF
ncbi:recombinase family protein [Streptomyces sp. Q6]|uniref:Recombinase family protein n=1 Tax=Streptomyces citrinus TaxID=3118173 RepID=A0ACD5A8G1_9ACTN